MRVFERLSTIVVTATLTSAFWIVAGGTLLDRAGGQWNNPASESAPTPSDRDGASRSVAGKPSVADRITVTAAPPGDLVIPVAAVKPGDLTDTFTASRAGGARLHDAIDIMATRGTPVIAAAPGKVEKLFLSDAGGKTVYVRSADGRTIYYYAHLDAYDAALREGAQVARGQSLGTVGSSGNASPDGPHLHFAILQTAPTAKWWEPATAINPYPLLAKQGR